MNQTWLCRPWGTHRTLPLPSPSPGEGRSSVISASSSAQRSGLHRIHKSTAKKHKVPFCYTPHRGFTCTPMPTRKVAAINRMKVSSMQPGLRLGQGAPAAAHCCMFTFHLSYSAAALETSQPSGTAHSTSKLCISWWCC